MNPRVVLVDPSGVRTIYEPASPDTSVRNVCISPNGKHLAIELLPPEREPDNYPNVPGYTGISTVFIDVETGSSSGGTNGFLPSWC